MRDESIAVFDWSDPGVREYLKREAGLVNFELRYDEVYFARTVSAIVAGELTHFEWRIECHKKNAECRQAARDYIARTGYRIFGEPWELSPS